MSLDGRYWVSGLMGVGLSFQQFRLEGGANLRTDIAKRREKMMRLIFRAVQLR